MFYHASPVGGIQVLQPHVSEQGEAMVYFSSCRENTLVYLGDPVRRFCRGAGIPLDLPCPKWATYGFDCAGIQVLEEYYPGYLEETFGGAAGYIYRVETVPGGRPLTGLLGAVATPEPVRAEGAEFIPDALLALEQADRENRIHLRRYETLPERMLAFIEKTVRQEFEAAAHPGYRAFLRAKFPFLGP